MLWVVARRALQQRAAVNADSAATEVEAARTLTDAAATFVHKLGGWAAIAALRPEAPAQAAPTFRLSDFIDECDPKSRAQTLVAGSHGVLDLLGAFAHVATNASSGRARRVASLARQAVWDEIKAEVDRATSPESVEDVSGDIERALARVGRLNGLLGLDPHHGTEDGPAGEDASSPSATPRGASAGRGAEDRVSKLLRRQLTAARVYALRTLRLASSDEWSRVPDRFTGLSAADDAAAPLASHPSLALDSAPSNPETPTKPPSARDVSASRSPSASTPPRVRPSHSSARDEAALYLSTRIRGDAPSSHDAADLAVSVRDCGGFVGLLGPGAMQRATSVQATSAARQAYQLVLRAGGADDRAMAAALSTFHQVHGSNAIVAAVATAADETRRLSDEVAHGRAAEQRRWSRDRLMTAVEDLGTRALSAAPSLAGSARRLLNALMLCVAIAAGLWLSADLGASVAERAWTQLGVTKCSSSALGSLAGRMWIGRLVGWQAGAGETGVADSCRGVAFLLGLLAATAVTSWLLGARTAMALPLVFLAAMLAKEVAVRASETVLGPVAVTVAVSAFAIVAAAHAAAACRAARISARRAALRAMDDKELQALPASALDVDAAVKAADAASWASPQAEAAAETALVVLAVLGGLALADSLVCPSSFPNPGCSLWAARASAGHLAGALMWD
ncbi:hypothetical protein FNF28_03059 [Cafeteria roenbergensis]|uniref:Uncharacterized protein n=1 Tax=Cafeteria roenbergensis TaxID=33653 RepID=A0A5A8DMQ2_CAFRO|nr:hypothetical protein FNF28_03059 [Cafeteria roenbergensis]